MCYVLSVRLSWQGTGQVLVFHVYRLIRLTIKQLDPWAIDPWPLRAKGPIVLVSPN